MRNTTILLLALGILGLAGCGGGGSNPPPAPTPDPILTASFVHTATALNTAGNATTLDHVYANGNPNAVLIVTPNWNPVNGGPMVWFDHPFAVAFSAGPGRWEIVTGDGSGVPLDASFNVTVATNETSGTVALFRHTAVASTLAGAVTQLNHALANSQPDNLVFCTRNLTPAGVAVPAQPMPFGVGYVTADSRWVIYNQDFTAMMENSAFNVAIMPAGGGGPFADAWIHRSIVGVTEFNYTYIGPLTRDAIVHAMPFQCALRGYTTAHGEHFNGVWFNEGGPLNWGVFNQDTDDMVVDCAFHVAVAAP